MMKRLLATLLMTIAFSVTLHGSDAQGIYSVDIAILVTDDQFISTSTGCTLVADGAWLTLLVNQTPYSPEEKHVVTEGRIVSAAGSPVLDTEGCVIEKTLYIGKFDTLSLVLSVFDAGSVESTEISLGTHQWSDIATVIQSRKPLVFVVDVGGMSSNQAVLYSEVSAPESAKTATPDYLATIEAQQREIDDLKATIEALETPAP